MRLARSRRRPYARSAPSLGLSRTLRWSLQRWLAAFPTEGAAKRLRPGGGFEDTTHLNPMRRIGRMEELQNLASFLMADGCEWLTGETIALDGAGYLASGSGAYFTQLDKLSDADWEGMRALIKAQNDKDRAGRSA